MSKIIYRLGKERDDSYQRIEWKDEVGGVKILFHKKGKSLIASLVSFNKDKFNIAESEQWLANRIAQYSLNSQIADITKYEEALLTALVNISPTFKEIAERYFNTQAMKNININKNTLFDWNSFLGKNKTAKQTVKSNKLEGIFNKDNEMWKVSTSVTNDITKKIKGKNNI